jgi:hypothetical protein
MQSVTKFPLALYTKLWRSLQIWCAVKRPVIPRMRGQKANEIL